MKKYVGTPEEEMWPHVGRVWIINQKTGGKKLLSRENYGWGYAGGGPHELAKDMLADCTGQTPDEFAKGFYQLIHLFVVQVISRLPRSEWTLTHDEVMQWLEAQYANEATAK